MLQRSYTLLIIGAALLISGIVISVLWASSFANSFLRQGIILNNVALAPSESGSNTIRISDLNHPIALQVHFEASDNSSSSQSRQESILLLVIILV
jgi:cytochrome b subunit of formate dehydrogenase